MVLAAVAVPQAIELRGRFVHQPTVAPASIGNGACGSMPNSRYNAASNRAGDEAAASRDKSWLCQ